MTPGGQFDIYWEATDAEDGGNLLINLYYSIDGGNSFPDVISISELNDGHYTWNIPELSCSTCKVLIRAIDTKGLQDEDMSDETFSIVTIPNSITLVQTWSMSAVLGSQYGLTWIDSYLWSIVIGKTIYQQNICDLPHGILYYSHVPGNGLGITWDREKIWVTGNTSLYRLKGIDGSVYDEIIPSEYTTPFTGLTWREGYIWAVNHNTRTAEIRKIDPMNGTVLEKYEVNIGSTITNAASIEWDPYRGVFWLGLHESNNIYMLDGSNPGEILQIFTVDGITGANGLALAFDGEILWVSSVDGGYLYKLIIT